jgi:metallo-beta-lactamase class B
MKVKEGSKTLDVVIIGSPNVNPGYKLIGNAAYPDIAVDFDRGFKVLKSLSCDYFLGAHGSYFGLEPKYEQLKSGVPSAFIDPDGYKKFVDQKEQVFRVELAKQKGVTQ